MFSRRRLVALENAVRGAVGQPKLVRAVPQAATAQSVRIGTAIERDVAMPIRPQKSRTIGTAAEHDTAMPVSVQLGPVSVRVGSSLTLRYDIHGAEVTVPDTPERQAAAFATVATGMTVGGGLAEQATHQTGYVVLGAIAGWWTAARLWNRWNRSAE